MQGVVNWFNGQKGYGFIKIEDGTDIFVHHTGIDCAGHRTLHKGARVKLEIRNTERGPKAVDVTLIGAGNELSNELRVGTIKHLSREKGYGFITEFESQTDLFFHASQVNGICFDDLQVGNRVSFYAGHAERGPYALNIALEKPAQDA